jgi:hypothetical protein
LLQNGKNAVRQNVHGNTEQKIKQVGCKKRFDSLLSTERLFSCPPLLEGLGEASLLTFFGMLGKYHESNHGN